MGVMERPATVYDQLMGDEAAGERPVVEHFIVRWTGRLSLARQFVLASLVVVLAGVALVSVWVSHQIEDGVMNRTGAVTALYVESVLSDPLQQLADQGHLGSTDIETLDRVLTVTPLGQHIQAFRVWSTTGEIVYSSNHALIGQRFAVANGLRRAALGEVSVDLSTLDEPEDADLRGTAERLLEVYAPLHQENGSRVLAVVEFYQQPDELEAEMAAARWRTWALVAGTGLVSYLLVSWVVKRGSDTISRQQRALEQQVADLERLLEQNRRITDQNTRLRERVQRAAARTTALNEQGLRRVSADLHAGPGQVLALAALRMETVQNQCALRCPVNGDFQMVHKAVDEALNEVRAISAGLRLPDLGPLTVAQVAERVVRNERRSGTSVSTDFVSLPDQAPLPIKIALYRALEEGLSNAARHGEGREVRARIRAEDGRLELTVSDQGPGFDPAAVAAGESLGLAALRERARLLGGGAQVLSAPGQGTTLRVWLPLPAPLSAADAAAVGLS
jgi:signal transduction histidine kinase